VKRPAFKCAGCGTQVDQAHGTAVKTALGTFASCHRCRERAQRSPRFRVQFACAVQAGVQLPKLQDIFASIGGFEVPTTPAEVDFALGLQEGSTEQALTAILKRGELGRP
jgi:hypothetical protein